jgi:mRNA-degrading endonuclease RelE of RelBE toxin-antitoxin system
MKKVLVLPSFERTARKLSRQEKKRLARSLETFNNFLIGGHPPYGFRFKKINHDKYEFRVDLKLRVIVKAESDIYYLVLVGDHEEIRRYLRSFR